MVLGSFRIALGVIACLLINANGADDYTDENRPYEFGFSIDGQQHRHEKKDKDGIIMGEFGFITADDVYHVTVYATDKEGRFKILSMKNIHLKSSQAELGTGAVARQGHSLALPPAAISPSAITSTAPPTTKSQIKSISLEPPARSCSSCSIPTTSTRAPPPAPANSPNQFGSGGIFSQRPSSVAQSQSFGGQQSSYANKPSYSQQGGFDTPQPNQLNQNNPDSQNSFIGAPNNSPSGEQNGYRSSESSSGIGGLGAQPGSKTPYEQTGTGDVNAGAPSPPYSQGGSPLSYPQGTAKPSYPQVGSRAQSPTHSGQEGSGAQTSYPQGGPGAQASYPPTGPGAQASYPQSGPGAETLYPQSGLGKQGSYPQSGSGEQTPYPQDGRGAQASYPQNGSGAEASYPQSGPGAQASYPQNGSGAEASYPQSGPGAQASYPQEGPGAQAVYPQGQEQSSNPGGSGTPREQSPFSPGVSEESSSYPQGDIGRTPKKYTGPEPQYKSDANPVKPTLVSAQMQIVDKNTDIHALRPGEKEGLPPGLDQDDMTQLLYTFNYTVGFHGHFEEGFTNGAKKGYYFVTGRNGVKTRIDYTADDTGFHPKVSQEVLDLLSDDVPKPETEKDAKYGLKGYEFKWLYYPVGSKKR